MIRSDPVTYVDWTCRRVPLFWLVILLFFLSHLTLIFTCYLAIDMSTFERLKLAYISSTGKEDPGVLAMLAFGSISGSVGATVSFRIPDLRPSSA